MAHALPADACLCDLNPAPVADYTFITDFLIFSTMTFPVFAGPKNLLAKQAVFFRFQRSVVYGLRLFYLTFGPFPDFFRGRQANLNGIKSDWLVCLLLHRLWHC